MVSSTKVTVVVNHITDMVHRPGLNLYIPNFILFFDGMMGNCNAVFFVLVIFIIVNQMVSGRLIQTVSTSNLSVSDGSDDLVSATTSPVTTCEAAYVFLPCATTVWAQIFLMVMYQYLLFLGQRYISIGTELIFKIIGTGIFGASAPIILGIPEAALVLTSGLYGSKETAQKQVSVGMGLQAGSIVMLLTLLWGSCVIVGKTDLEGCAQKDIQDTKGFSLTGSGISTDIWTSYMARIMTASMIPFVIVQLSQVFHTSSVKRLAVLISLILAVALLFTYWLYEVFQPWIQERSLDYLKHKHVISGILRHLKQHALGRLLTDDGEPNEPIIRKLFKTIDENNDGCLSHAELRALIIGIRFDEIDLDLEEAAQKVMSDIDTDKDDLVNEDEFFKGISKWLQEAKRAARQAGDDNPHTHKFLDHFHMQTKQEHVLLGSYQDEEDEEQVVNAKWITIKAVWQLLLGIAITIAFADPVVDTVDSFSAATRIPIFYISFIALPIATNSREAVTAMIYASKKKMKSSSLTFSETYEAVTVKNLLNFAVFLSLVYVRDLSMDFSAEVMIILIVCIVMGLLASLRTVFPLWMSLVAYALYPFSLLLFYVLHYRFGWS